MARLGREFFGPWAGVFAAFALNVSAYHTAAVEHVRPARRPAPVLLAPDARRAGLGVRVARPKLGRWAWVGLAWGGAMLSKYHAIFLPAGALLYILAEPSARGFCSSRALTWPRRSAWRRSRRSSAGTPRTAGRRSRSRGPGDLAKPPSTRPDTLASAIGGQAAYLFPWIWLMLVVLLVQGPPGVPPRGLDRPSGS